MKRALCVNKIEEIGALINKETETIDCYFVDREICEDPNNYFLQIIPYVTFFTVNQEEGKIKFVQYLRAAVGDEDRLLSKTSIGFGGHIDQITDIDSKEVIVQEDTTEQFVMTLENLTNTLFKSAKRELQEELGVAITNVLDTEFIFNDCAFFLGDQSDDVNKVHVGFSIPVKLTEEQFETFFNSVNINKEEIDTIDRLNLNIRNIIEEMDVTVTLAKINNELKHKFNIEDWSCKVFEYITRKEIGHLLKDVTYDDISKIIYEKQKA